MAPPTNGVDPLALELAAIVHRMRNSISVIGINAELLEQEGGVAQVSVDDLSILRKAAKNVVAEFDELAAWSKKRFGYP